MQLTFSPQLTSSQARLSPTRLRLAQASAPQQSLRFGEKHETLSQAILNLKRWLWIPALVALTLLAAAGYQSNKTSADEPTSVVFAEPDPDLPKDLEPPL